MARSENTKKGNSYSYLPEGLAAVDAACRKAKKVILKFASVHLPLNYADADEPIDPVERCGFSSSLTDVICLEDEEDTSETFRPLHEAFSVFVEMSGNYSTALAPAIESVFQSRHDACFELFGMASLSRGTRASAELRILSRMNH